MSSGTLRTALRYALLAAACVTTMATSRAEGATAVSDDQIAAALGAAGDNRAEIQRAIDEAPEDQRGAMRFLVAYMPDRDLTTLTAEYLLKNVDYAFRAREATAWGSEIPDEVFFNDVLPYAAVNERRDDWRADFFERFMPLVKQCRTPGEAAQLLNRQMFPLLDVQYHARNRPKPDQSPYESIEAKYASCTGLSILLIDACRAVCVPTRFAGTASWTTKRGNHSWVEVWSDGDWHFTGACEPDPNGLDRGWFVGDAAQADGGNRRNAIYASSWKTTGEQFPMVWARRDDSVAAINVTDRYKPKTERAAIPDDEVLVGIDVFSASSGERVVSQVTVRSGDEATASGATTGTGDDTNNRLEVLLSPESEYVVEIEGPDGVAMKEALRTTAEPRQYVRYTLASATNSSDDPIAELQAYLAQPYGERSPIAEQGFASVALSQEQAAEAARLLWADRAAWIRETRASEMEAKAITLADKTLRFEYKIFGDKPEGGRSLHISMHGGGNAPPRVNDRQWENQKGLYEPAEGVYLAPRAPTDTWNLWHEAHIDPLFDRLIADLVVFEDVNPDRVYLMGYSAGGDGVYQLAPRMADRFAAAAMMAGHPNEISPLSLRNLPFTLHMGGDDGAYNRNTVAREWNVKLAELHLADPGGYTHVVDIHQGKGHWMEREDAIALPWMARFTRNLRPDRIVWKQDDVTHGRFYWLAVDEAGQTAGAEVRAERDGQMIDVTADAAGEVTVLLDDALVNLDEPVVVRLGGEEKFSGRVDRTIAALAKSLDVREDPAAMFPARVTVTRE